MEKNIFKKLNSIEYFKKVLFFLIFTEIKKNQKIFFNRYIRVSHILANNMFYIYNGLKFIKLNILFFFSGLILGSFILNKKHNKHISLKKLKSKKR